MSVYCWRFIQKDLEKDDYSLAQIPEWEAQGQKCCHIGFGGEPTLIQLYAPTPEMALQKVQKMLELMDDSTEKGCPACDGDAEVNKQAVDGGRPVFQLVCKKCGLATPYTKLSHAERIWNGHR